MIGPWFTRQRFLAATCSRMRQVLVSVLAACFLGPVAAQVDFNVANDYYTVQGSSQVKVVEQYHLGPCDRLMRQRDYVRAYGECNFILRIFPNHPQALLLTTQICMQWNSPMCMLDDTFATAISINPKAPGTFIVQGIYYHRVKQYPKAIQSFTFALGLDSNGMNAHYNLALTYLETRQFDLANKHAQRAYQLGANLPGLRDRLRAAGHWNTSSSPDSLTIDPARDAAAVRKPVSN